MAGFFTDMDKITVTTNWDLKDKDSLKKIITCSSPENIEFDIGTVTTNSCVCLNKPNNTILDLAPELEFESINLIQQIDLLSEGNLIEIFGNHDEYLGSCTSNFIDDWDGMAVYHAKIPLPKLSKCKLKFKRMKEENRIWIYNAQVSTLNLEEDKKDIIFNFDNVNKLINNSNHHISEKAKKFKNFLELCVKNSNELKISNAPPPDFQTVFNLISKEQVLKFHESNKSLTLQQNPSEVSSPTASEGNISSVTKNEDLSMEHLKTYIDNRLKEVQNEIMECVEVKLSKFQEEINSKLNTIIKLLQPPKKSSFVD